MNNAASVRVQGATSFHDSRTLTTERKPIFYCNTLDCDDNRSAHNDNNYRWHYRLHKSTGPHQAMQPPLLISCHADGSCLFRATLLKRIPQHEQLFLYLSRVPTVLHLQIPHLSLLEELRFYTPIPHPKLQLPLRELSHQQRQQQLEPHG